MPKCINQYYQVIELNAIKLDCFCMIFHNLRYSNYWPYFQKIYYLSFRKTSLFIPDLLLIVTLSYQFPKTID